MQEIAPDRPSAIPALHITRPLHSLRRTCGLASGNIWGGTGLSGASSRLRADEQLEVVVSGRSALERERVVANVCASSLTGLSPINPSEDCGYDCRDTCQGQSNEEGQQPDR